MNHRVPRAPCPVPRKNSAIELLRGTGHGARGTFNYFDGLPEPIVPVAAGDRADIRAELLENVAEALVQGFASHSAIANRIDDPRHIDVEQQIRIGEPLPRESLDHRRTCTEMMARVTDGAD